MKFSKQVAAYFAVASSLVMCSLNAATWTVNSNTDTGAGAGNVGDLRFCLTGVASGDTIQILPNLGTITLMSHLPNITANLTINGPSPNQVIDASFFQALAVSSGTVSMSNLTIENSISQGSSGGAGRTGSGGGGGSFGAGGAIFLQRGANLTVTNVNFMNNQAVGGAGGPCLETATTSFGGGGGGGGAFFGGTGGFGGQITAAPTAGAGGGGGGGDFGSIANAGTLQTGGDGGNGDSLVNHGHGAGVIGLVQSAGGGGGGGGLNAAGGDATAGTQGVGGSGGNGGGALGTGGGGGGGGTTSETLAGSAVAGAGANGGTVGGGGGGGGGGFSQGGNGGAGGFGSGGGGGGGSANGGFFVMRFAGVGGLGGFGGGSGGGGTLAVTTGNTIGGGGGGGGAGFGGALVAFNGSTLTIVDGSFSNNFAFGGTGGTGIGGGVNGVSGSGFGQDIFLQAGSAAIFNVSGTLTLLNPIQSDTGTPGATVTKTGSGTLKLNGANTFTGGTTISGGILNLNGSVIGPVVVGINSTFSGNATINTSGSSIGNLTNSGTVFPGNSIGTIVVAGNYTQNASGTLDIELSPSGTNSLLSISGTATLNGTVDFIMEPGTYISGTTYTFLTASGGVINQFSSVVFSEPNVDASVIYGPTFVQLLLRSMGPFVPVGFPPLFRPGLDPNPAAVAKYLDGFTMTAGSDLFNIFTILETLNLDALNCALNQLQPSLFGGGFSITEQENSLMVRSAVSRRLALLHDTRCCEAILKNRRVGMWGDVFGGYLRQGHLHDNSRFHASSVGFAAGLDYLFLETLTLGAFGGFVASDIDWTEHCALADGDIDSGYGGVYATWFPNIFFLNASAFGASNDYKGTRKIQFSTIDRRAKHHQDGSEFAANINFGVNVPLGLGFFQPFANFDYIHLHQEGYTEHGAQTLNLKVRSKNTNMLRSQIGVKRTVCFHFDWGSLVPDVSLSWARESRFGSRKYKAALKNFVNTHGFFTVQIGKPSRNLFVPNVGLTGEFFGGRLAVGGSYDAAIGRHFSENIFSARADLKF